MKNKRTIRTAEELKNFILSTVSTYFNITQKNNTVMFATGEKFKICISDKNE